LVLSETIIPAMSDCNRSDIGCSRLGLCRNHGNCGEVLWCYGQSKPLHSGGSGSSYVPLQVSSSALYPISMRCLAVACLMLCLALVTRLPEIVPAYSGSTVGPSSVNTYQTSSETGGPHHVKRNNDNATTSHRHKHKRKRSKSISFSPCRSTVPSRVDRDRQVLTLKWYM